MYQEWLRGRDQLYGNLSEDDLKHAYARFFVVAERVVLNNKRVLLLFERIAEQEGAAMGAKSPYCEMSHA